MQMFILLKCQADSGNGLNKFV